jgi:hypothetical protein
MDICILEVKASLLSERRAYAAGVRQAKLDRDPGEQLRCLRGMEQAGRGLAALEQYLATHS